MRTRVLAERLADFTANKHSRTEKLDLSWAQGDEHDIVQGKFKGINLQECPGLEPCGRIATTCRAQVVQSAGNDVRLGHRKRQRSIPRQNWEYNQRWQLIHVSQKQVPKSSMATLNLQSLFGIKEAGSRFRRPPAAGDSSPPASFKMRPERGGGGPLHIDQVAARILR